MKRVKKLKTALALFCAAVLMLSVLPGAFAFAAEGDAGTETVTPHSGTYMLRSALKGEQSLWAYVEQEVSGIAANTDYSFGMWVKGRGIVTMKVSSNGSTVTYKRPVATDDWTYESVDFNSGAKSGKMVFSVVDSAATAFPQNQVAGTMYIDGAYFGAKDSGVNLLQNSGFEQSLAGWNSSVKDVFSVVATDETTPGEPTDPTDPQDPNDDGTNYDATDPSNATNIYAGNRSMQAVTKGLKSDWKSATQQIAGITANTDYTFGAWIKGSGAVTIKAAKLSGGENLHFMRPKAADVWTHVTTSFNSGSYAGTIVFSILDSAGNVLPQSEAAGTMYIDEATFGPTGGANLLRNAGFEEQLKYWGGDKGNVFVRYPDQSDNPPAQQYEGIANLGAYSWDRNPDGVSDFGAWTGTTPYLAEDFLEQNTWSDLEGGNRLDAWKDSPYAQSMLWATYPFPKSGGSLAAAAHGDYNAHYRELGENLIAAGMDNAMIRFGHEFNGGWYYWTVGNANEPDHEQKCADFAEAFRQFVTTLRSIDGEHFKFVWNPSTAVWGVDLPAAFPGRDYVDFIGIDHYDQTWAQSNGQPLYGPEYQTADPAERARRQQLAWNAEVSDGNWGLGMIADFAEDQGVPLGICEWGLATRSDGMGGGDNPVFIQNMHDWIANNNVAWHVYFNVSASDGDHDLYDTVTFPQASAKFSELWNPSGAPQTSPAIEPSDIVASGESYAKLEGEDGVLAGSAFRYHGDPWASGGEFAVMYRSLNALTFANAPQADDGIAIVYQGWQSDQRASLYVNDVLVKKNILFAQHGRSWSNSYGYVVLSDVRIPAGATVKLQINKDDELDNFDSLKIDYVLLLGTSGGSGNPPANPGDGGSAVPSVKLYAKNAVVIKENGGSLEFYLAVNGADKLNAVSADFGFDSTKFSLRSVEAVGAAGAVVDNRVSGDTVRVLAGFPASMTTTAYTDMIKLTFDPLDPSAKSVQADLRLLAATIASSGVNADIEPTKDGDSASVVLRAYADLGDVNGDGSLTAADLSLALDHYRATPQAADWSSAWRADVNADGIVDTTDFTIIAAGILDARS
ncbi:glycosyl hydrolase [Paenibacillus glycinis]|uniref:GH26 domain-containing protein n=1 Tax=Paenibacillus glycinis TaxID=2697035 RepID=A0ABW9XSS0_9BACL|nr:glycosyl hydrolase [Paenibacillus glycinis]NBD25703.1 hypothetical protein [Paenibacillus glycinis]